MTRNHRKADVRRLQRPFIVSLVSLLLLAGQTVLAGDGIPSAGDGSPKWLQPKTGVQLNQTPRDVIDVRITDNMQCIQQRLSEINGKPTSPMDAAAWSEGQAGHSLAKSDYALTGVEQTGTGVIQKVKDDLNKYTRIDNDRQIPAKINASKTDNGAIVINAKEINRLKYNGEAKYDPKTLQATGSVFGSTADGKYQTYTIAPDGSQYAFYSVDGSLAKGELTGSAGTKGVEFKGELSALSGSVTYGGGVVTNNTLKGVSVEIGANMGVGGTFKPFSEDGSEVKGSFGLTYGEKSQNEKLPQMSKYQKHQNLIESGITPEAYKYVYLPNRSEPSQLNTIIADCERARGETRGDETVLARDPGTDTGAGQAAAPPVPVDGKGILVSSPGSNSTAQEGGDRRQGMKDQFNSSKQQYDQAARQRQMERDAQAAQQQSNGQMQDFLSIMNSAIIAGSAARTAPPTAGSTPATPSTAGSSSGSPSNKIPYKCEFAGGCRY